MMIIAYTCTGDVQIQILCIGVEIDYKKNFAFIGEPVEVIFANPEKYGWEVPGDYNTM
jgi:hypothetical protein